MGSEAAVLLECPSSKDTPMRSLVSGNQMTWAFCGLRGPFRPRFCTWSSLGKAWRWERGRSAWGQHRDRTQGLCLQRWQGLGLCGCTLPPPLIRPQEASLHFSVPLLSPAPTYAAAQAMEGCVWVALWECREDPAHEEDAWKAFVWAKCAHPICDLVLCTSSGSDCGAPRRKVTCPEFT